MTDYLPSVLIRASIRAEHLSLKLFLNKKQELKSHCHGCVKLQQKKVFDKIASIRESIVYLNNMLIDRNENPEEEL
jgi:hypothetical protein